MAYNNAIITAPVSIQDVKQCLGNSSTDLGTLCRAVNINMWAKYKPVKHGTEGLLNDETRSGQTVNYGIGNIPVWTNINKMANFWFGINTTSTNAPDCGIQSEYWKYIRPEGESSSPYRLSDFSQYPLGSTSYGYFHGAEAPIKSSGITNYTVSSGNQLSIQYINGALNERTIKLSELHYGAQFIIENMNYGLMLRKLGTQDIYAITVRKMSELSQSAAVHITDWSGSEGIYEIFPFCTTESIPTLTKDLGGFTTGYYIALLDKETVAIGTDTVILSPSGFSTYYDTTKSTRLLYFYLTLDNSNRSSVVDFKVEFTVYNASNVVIKSFTKTGLSVAQNSYYNFTPDGNGQLDMESRTNLISSYSVRAIITPTNSANVAQSSIVCDVTKGPSRDE